MSESMYSIVMLVVVFAIMYFLMIRPENKRKKEQEEMRNNIGLGDEIITIGGMVGKVVQVTEETVTFETGEDRVRIQVKKWAIQTNERAEAKAKEAAEAMLDAIALLIFSPCSTIISPVEGFIISVAAI